MPQGLFRRRRIKWGQCPPVHSASPPPTSRFLCNEIGISRGEARRGEREREDLYLKIGCHKKKKVGWSERMKKEEEEEQICLPTHSETT